MSDGHFNRSFLPQNPLQSGLKMGKSIARKAGEDALTETMESLELNSDLQSRILNLYKTKVQEKLAK